MSASMCMPTFIAHPGAPRSPFSDMQAEPGAVATGSTERGSAGRRSGATALGRPGRYRSRFRARYRSRLSGSVVPKVSRSDTNLTEQIDTCPVCERPAAAALLAKAAALDPLVERRIAASRPGWAPQDGVCPACVQVALQA